MRTGAKLIFVQVIFGLLAASAYADTISTWSSVGNWSDATKWAPLAVPNNSSTAQYDVTIASGTATVDISPTVNSLTVNQASSTPTLTGPTSGPGPTLTVVHDATIGGALIFAPGTTQPATGAAALSVGGNLNVGRGAFFGVANDPVIVGGNLTNASPNMEVVGSGPIKVGGTLTNETSGVLFLGNDKCFSLNCPPPGFLNTPPTAGPATSATKVVNNGTIYGWSDITASSLVNKGSALFVGGGPTVGTLANGGTLSLGNSCCSLAEAQTAGIGVGTGSLGFGYNQSATGVLDELLLGNSSYGTIATNHGTTTGYSVNLNGTLDIMLQNGFTPSAGESFTIFTFAPGELSGAFSDVTWDSFDNGQGYFKVTYENAAGDVVIQAEAPQTEAAPEPGSLFLFAPALGLLLWASRKRLGRKHSHDPRTMVV